MARKFRELFMSNSPDDLMIEAQSQILAGNKVSAEQTFQKILLNFPDHKPALVELNKLKGAKASSGPILKGSIHEYIESLGALFRQGKLKETIKVGTYLANEYPDQLNLHTLVGTANLKLKKFEAAIENFTKAIQIDPKSVVSHLNLGVALKNTGKVDLAIESYEQALTIMPDYPEALNNLGSALNIKGEFDAAVEKLTKALEIRLEYPEAHYNIGAAFKGKKDLGAALHGYKNAIKLQPDHFKAHVELGEVLTNQKEYEEAIKILKKALTLEPKSIVALQTLSKAFEEKDNLKKAIDTLKTALELAPKHGGLNLQMGNLSQQSGALDEAKKYLHKALELRPDQPEAHRAVSITKKYKSDDPQIIKMSKLLATDGLVDEGRMHLNFAMAKAMSDTNNYEEAFKNYVSGNKIRHNLLNYRIEQDQTLFSKIKEWFEEDKFIGSDDVKYPDANRKNPIFILGMMRSGTTLTEQIISSHSQVYGAGELSLLSRSVGKSGWINSNKPTKPSIFSRVRSNYMEGIDQLNATEPYITDKMPVNHRWVGFILSSMPDAKVINLQRDARATCWSNFKHYFAPDGNGYTYNIEDLVEYYNMYVDLMEFWRQKYPGRIYDLNYERLTENQEEETRKLIEYTGLEWEDQCLSFQDNERRVKTASLSQVRQKMYQGSSDEWRKYEPYLGEMLSALKGI